MDKAYIAAAVSISLWFITQWLRMFINSRQKNKECNNLIRALYSEVDFNTAELNAFSENSADLRVLEEKLRENKNLVPHIADAQHTLIYSSNILNLHYISNTSIAHLVQFYGLLDKTKAQIDGLNQNSFTTISSRGKYLTLKRIIVYVGETEKVGIRILKNLEHSHPKLQLTRKFLPLMDTKQR